MASDIISQRKKIRNKKPSFIRQDGRNIKRLGKSWRKPRGTHSKMRLKRRGKPVKVNIGYRTPTKLRGINPKGLVEVRVSRPEDLQSLVKTKHTVVLSRTLGLKKKLELAKKVSDLGLTLQNTDLKLLESKLKTKLEKAKAKKEKKAKKKPAKEKKKAEKKEEKPKEERKVEEKKEEKPKEEQKPAKKPAKKKTTKPKEKT
jgi:large subunit ribosomal protein L32e